MDFVDILVLGLLLAAAIAAYVIFAVRGGIRLRREPAVPRAGALAGLKLKNFAETASGVRAPSERVVSPPPRVPAPAAAPLFDLDSEPLATERVAFEATVVEPPASEPPASDLPASDLPIAAPAQIRWCRQFDSRSETLDDVSRLRLIGDLGVVAKEWCVPLLAQAYQEEQRRSHRQAALTALAACHSRAAAGTFRAALAAGDAAERAIAADGLADLEPAQQAKVRRTVERF